MPQTILASFSSLVFLCMHAARISPPPRNDDSKDNDNIESFSSNDDEDY